MYWIGWGSRITGSRHSVVCPKYNRGEFAVSRSVTLPDDLFNKLAHGAAQRGLTIEGLLAFVSDIVVLPEQPGQEDRERQRLIEQLFAKYRAGPLTARDRAKLSRLIDADYRAAIARADQLIGGQKAHASESGEATAPHGHSSSKPAKRSRK
jgi:hypothetical protein